jgi:hypothetical protein
VSGQLVNTMSPYAREKMRQIDRVTVKGSTEPLEMYTCDVENNDLALDPYEHKPSRREMKLRRVKARIARDRYR